MTTLEHITVKAAATATDRGQFSAIAATYSDDRVGDRIIPGAFAQTIAAWQSSQKNVPLHWDHVGSADHIIGWVDPNTMRETNEGLYVEGQLDLKGSGIARDAWRSMKNNAVSLSFGYLTKSERKSKDGINELLELDLFEVSIVPAPANADTRILSVKAIKEMAGIEDAKAVWSAAYINDLPDSAFLYVEPGGKKDEQGKTTPRSLRHFPVKNAEGDVDMPHLRNALSRIPQSNLSQSVKDRCAAKAQRMMDAMKSISAVEDGGDEEPERAKSAPQDPLRKRSEEVALALASEGLPPGRYIEPEPEPEPVPLDERELRRRSDAARLRIAGG